MKSIYVHRANSKYWQIPILLMALIGLFVLPVYAASFDCSKAATEMEKTICSDSKLSALDEDLAKVYGEIKSQLKGDAQALEQFTKSQREWLAGLQQKKDGNIACAASKECLTISYQKRVKELQDKLSLALKKAPSESGAEKKYPPYPDVWGYELPFTSATGGESDRYLQMDAAKMDNGDYLITYIKKLVFTKQKDIHLYFSSISFFSSEKRDFKEEEYNLFWKQHKRVRGRLVTFKDGSEIRQRGDDSGRCVLPFNEYLVRVDKNKEVIARKNIFYIADKPYKKRPCQLITEPPQNDFYTRVAEVGSLFNFILLEDETFLLVEFDGNTIIRFDKYFNTKSDLLNKKIFIVDRAVIDEIKNRLKKEDKWEEQSYYDAVFNYLMSVKMEGGGK